MIANAFELQKLHMINSVFKLVKQITVILWGIG